MPQATAKALTGRPSRPIEKSPERSATASAWMTERRSACGPLRRNRASNIGKVTSRYARFTQTMATEQRVSMTRGKLMFTINSAAASPPIRSGGRIGAAPLGHVAERPRNGRLLSEPSRRPTGPSRRGRQRADEHGEDDVGQEQGADTGAQYILDQEGKAARDPAEFREGRVAHREDAEKDQQPTGHGGGAECQEDRPRRPATRLPGLLGQGTSGVKSIEDVRCHQCRGQE